MCIIILKHTGMSNLKNIVNPTFLPLFLVCPSTNAGRKWLQDHYNILQPFYQKYDDEFDNSNKKNNIQMDDVHFKNIKRKIKLFRNLMTKLQNGENIFDKFHAAPDNDSEMMPVEKTINSNKDVVTDKEDSSSYGSKKIKKKPKIKTVKKNLFDDATNKNLTRKFIIDNGMTDDEKKEKLNKSDDLVRLKIIALKSTKEDESVQIQDGDLTEKNSKTKTVGYDPSDLFGLLATSRSTGSSDESGLDNYKKNIEKNENRLKQVAKAMSTIFSTSDTTTLYSIKNEVDFKTNSGLKNCITRKSSEETLEPVKKDLSPALNYLQSLFEDFIAKHQKVWNYERMNNYPDYKTTGNEDKSVQLIKLKVVLTQLESHYLHKLDREWDLLINVIRNKVWYSEEASNDVISKLQELLLQKESQIIEKFKKIEEEEIKNKYLEKKTTQQQQQQQQQPNDNLNNHKGIDDIHIFLDRLLDLDGLNMTTNLKSDTCGRALENDFTLNQRMPPINGNVLQKTSSQSKLLDVVDTSREFPLDLSQGSSGNGLELNTIFFNKGYKSDSYSEIVSIGSKTKSSQSIPTPRNDNDDKKDQYNLWNKTSDNPLQKLFKTVREGNESSSTSSSSSARNPNNRFFCWVNEISNLKKMIKNSHVQYGEILLPNPLKSGKILLPYGETGYFGSVEMGLDHKGNPMAVKHVKKSFPTSVDILSNIMIRLKKINNKYILPYYMSEGFEPIIATPLMDFNLGQYILHLKNNCILESKSFDIIKQV